MQVGSVSSKESVSLPIAPNGNESPLQPLFDKYVVNSAEEMALLNKKGLLKGAFVITGDKKHVGIHKIFWVAQKIRQLMEKFRGLFLPKRELNTDLCHGMIVVGWDGSYSEKKKGYNNRPLLAHSVMDGVKLNAVDYFNYDDKDVDHMYVYVPKDPGLREEYAKNGKLSSEISSKKENRSKFSWGKLLTSIFKSQIHKSPTAGMQKQLAYSVADLLLERKLSNGGNENSARAYYCMEYAIEMLQASILTKALGPEEKKNLMQNEGRALTREELAKRIYHCITKGDTKADPLAKAYWESRICTQINAKCILSSYASFALDKISETKSVPEKEAVPALKVMPSKKPICETVIIPQGKVKDLSPDFVNKLEQLLKSASPAA